MTSWSDNDSDYTLRLHTVPTLAEHQAPADVYHAAIAWAAQREPFRDVRSAIKRAAYTDPATAGQHCFDHGYHRGTEDTTERLLKLYGEPGSGRGGARLAGLLMLALGGFGGYVFVWLLGLLQHAIRAW